MGHAMKTSARLLRVGRGEYWTKLNSLGSRLPAILRQQSRPLVVFDMPRWRNDQQWIGHDYLRATAATQACANRPPGILLHARKTSAACVSPSRSNWTDR